MVQPEYSIYELQNNQQQQVEMARETVFQSTEELRRWLVEWCGATSIGLVTVEDAAEHLFAAGFDRPSTLYKISPQWLWEAGVEFRPMCQHLSNNLTNYTFHHN